MPVSTPIAVTGLPAYLDGQAWMSTMVCRRPLAHCKNRSPVAGRSCRQSGQKELTASWPTTAAVAAADCRARSCCNIVECGQA